MQAILTELEELPSDVQLAVYTRLLSGLTNKLTSTLVKNALAAAKVDQQTPKPKGTIRKATSAGQKATTESVPRANSMLRQLNDPFDPIEAWRRFGGSAAEMLDVLREEPQGVLEAMLRHHNMPPGPKPRGKSREKLAEAIALRLEQQFRGA
ncbi:MAG: hypothetical protein ABI068_06720 [Ktedonobacterales bacterium]